jgi:O-antigen/teichoic acid export membrane protein
MARRYQLPRTAIQESRLLLVGLIGISVVIVQALIVIGPKDPAGVIALFAFAVSLPVLGALAIVDLVFERYRYASFPAYLNVAYFIGENGAAVGVVAAFWHVSWVAGVLVLISGAFGLTVYLFYSRRLERENASEGPAPRE